MRSFQGGDLSEVESCRVVAPRHGKRRLPCCKHGFCQLPHAPRWTLYIARDRPHGMRSMITLSEACTAASDIYQSGQTGAYAMHGAPATQQMHYFWHTVPLSFPIPVPDPPSARLPGASLLVRMYPFLTPFGLLLAPSCHNNLCTVPAIGAQRHVVRTGAAGCTCWMGARPLE